MFVNWVLKYEFSVLPEPVSSNLFLIEQRRSLNVFSIILFNTNRFYFIFFKILLFKIPLAGGLARTAKDKKDSSRDRTFKNWPKLNSRS